MAVKLAESERAGFSLVAHAQHVQQSWVNCSHTHFMISGEINRLENELDHMHADWTRLSQDNEKLALKLEENGNYSDVVLSMYPL